MTFVDWHREALEAHRRELGSTPRYQWVRGDALDGRSFGGAWLVIHATLPRLTGSEGEFIKPRTPSDSARVMSLLRRSGARGAFILALGVERDVSRDGIQALGLRSIERDGVALVGELTREVTGTSFVVEFEPAD